MKGQPITNDKMKLKTASSVVLKINVIGMPFLTIIYRQSLCSIASDSLAPLTLLSITTAINNGLSVRFVVEFICQSGFKI